MNKENAPLKAPIDTKISCKSWHQEAALRMLMNNLDPDVAEKPIDIANERGIDLPMINGS